MLLFDAAGFAVPGRRRPLVAARRAPLPGVAPLAFAARPAARRRAPGPLARRGAVPGARGSRALPDVGTALRQLTSPAPATELDRTRHRAARRRFRRGVARGRARPPGARHGATVNDVLLAASTIALGRALRRRGERPSELKALVPVNVRGAGGAGDLGNAISFVTVELPVGRGRPGRASCAACTAACSARKAGGAAGPLRPSRSSATCCPAARAAACTRAAAGSAAFNVRGLQRPRAAGRPRRCSGRRAPAIFPAVPFLARPRLSIGALSYRGRLHLGLYADADVVPDVVDVARDLEAAFDALRLPPGPRDTPWRARAQRRRAATRRA